MCGIFGIVSSSIDHNELFFLARHAQQRGRDSSGLVYLKNNEYKVSRADFAVCKLLEKVEVNNSSVIMGHSRLITNGLKDNQPIILNNSIVLHNGIIVNDVEVWAKTQKKRTLEIDTEIIAALADEHVESGLPLTELTEKVLSLCKGVVASAILIPKLGKILLFSNNGSLYIGDKNGTKYFSSESFPLSQLKCRNIKKVKNVEIIDVEKSLNKVEINDINQRKFNLIPQLVLKSSEEKHLIYPTPELKRCSRCILPTTMPFITFDKEGVCNYCNNYKLRNVPRPKEELFKLVEPYRRDEVNDCIVPFSGGRDSCYALHLIVNELKMRPITYTYDWGMVTDLGRRNISRMCSALGVENIIVADDIAKKRENIRKNLVAWLKSPHLGMISILTAGDKHFFRHVETVKKQTGINLNLWGVNPLEVTHFKTGFLGIEPDFVSTKVYTNGMLKQLRYQLYRLRAMSKSLGYFNSSLWDTISGEYYRSLTKKDDYYHIFDYWRWDEKIIDNLLKEYEWERAPDTNTTWRIGDGTAAFYNYIYYVVAGFTEHDTFRSNQIREGDMTREVALTLVLDENIPRYPNIKWYLDTVGIDFQKTIKVINSMPRLY